MSNAMLEAMASGLPIAASNRSAVPEILGDAALYFDPVQPEEIAEAMHSLMEDSALRERCAWRAYERSQAYSWTRCARETLALLSDVACRA